MTVDPNARLLDLASASLERSLSTKSRLDRVALPALVEVVVAVQHAFAAGGKVVLFGNGGSASDAQHIAAELVGRYVKERRSLPAIALNTDTSALTAIGNDYGYEHVFSRQVEGLVRPDDVVIGLSTSGNSPNVVRALESAKEIGARTVAFTGARHSTCHDIADFVVSAPDIETARIQECHILLGHVLCELIDAEADETETQSRSVHAGVTDELLADRDRWRARGLRVVVTNGVFDLLHAGHLTSLEVARSLGDVLVVAVNSDLSVRRLKGDDRPVVDEADRARLVAGLSCVDSVVIFDDDDASTIVRHLEPEVWCKGGDYAGRDRSSIPEAVVVESYGGDVEFLPMVDGRSTTAVIDQLRSSGHLA